MTPNLTDKQQIAAEAILAGLSITSAAQQANISREQVHKWIADDMNGFNTYLDTERARIRQHARKRLTALIDGAIDVMWKTITDETIPPQTRLAAARDLLDRGGYAPVKQVEVVTIDAIDAEIRRLEAELGLEEGEPIHD